MKKKLFGLIFLFLSLGGLYLFLHPPEFLTESEKEVAPTWQDFESILDEHMDQVESAVALKRILNYSNREYLSEKHIPEFSVLLKNMKSFLKQSSADEEETKKKNLDLIFKQMDTVMNKKAMSAAKWVLFHYQVLVLFSDAKKSPWVKGIPKDSSVLKERYGTFFSPKEIRRWGRLNFRALGKQAQKRLKDPELFPYFIYSDTGLMGVRALSRAFLEGITVLPITLNHSPYAVDLIMAV